MSKIQTLSDLTKLTLVLKDNIGFVPDNLILVSPEIMSEIKAHNGIPQNQPLSNITILDMTIMSDVAEVIV
jgi:hypothetical protein